MQLGTKKFEKLFFSFLNSQPRDIKMFYKWIGLFNYPFINQLIIWSSGSISELLPENGQSSSCVNTQGTVAAVRQASIILSWMIHRVCEFSGDLSTAKCVW